MSIVQSSHLDIPSLIVEPYTTFINTGLPGFPWSIGSLGVTPEPLPWWKRALGTFTLPHTWHVFCVLAADNTILINSSRHWTDLLIENWVLNGTTLHRILKGCAASRNKPDNAQLLLHLINIPKHCFRLTTPLILYLLACWGSLGFRVSQQFTGIHAHSFLYTGRWSVRS